MFNGKATPTEAGKATRYDVLHSNSVASLKLLMASPPCQCSISRFKCIAMR
jgi:hypothetical protein